MCVAQNTGANKATRNPQPNRLWLKFNQKIQRFTHTNLHDVVLWSGAECIVLLEFTMGQCGTQLYEPVRGNNTMRQLSSHMVLPNRVISAGSTPDPGVLYWNETYYVVCLPPSQAWY